MLAHCSPSSKWVPGGNTGEDKGGEERNWPPYLTCRWLRISVLSHRHSPTYESIRDYLYLTILCYLMFNILSMVFIMPLHFMFCFISFNFKRLSTHCSILILSTSRPLHSELFVSNWKVCIPKKDNLLLVASLLALHPYRHGIMGLVLDT